MTTPLLPGAVGATPCKGLRRNLLQSLHRSASSTQCSVCGRAASRVLQKGPGRRGHRLAIKATAEGSGDELALAAVKPKTPLGLQLAYLHKAEPHLLKDAVDVQLARIKDEREAAEQEPTSPQPSDSTELVLYKRMEELRKAEDRAAVEDLMYASILSKFMEIGVEMMSRIENVSESQQALSALTAGVHSAEALEMVKEHVRALIGVAAQAPSNVVVKIPKLQAAQVYMASTMFGYFLRRVDKRFQLERSLGTLPEDPKDAVERLERLFAQAAEAANDSDDPDAPVSSPGIDVGEAAAAVAKPGALRRYIETFDQQTMMQMAQTVSVEGAALIETQTNALFSNIQALQRQMQEVVGSDARSMQELMERVQAGMNSGKVETVTITAGTQRRVVLEAVAFGAFLRDVESHVDTEYGLLTPMPLMLKGPGGGGDGPQGPSRPGPQGPPGPGGPVGV